MFNTEKLVEKWSPVLESTDAPAIGNKYKAGVIAQVLENTERQLAEDRSHASFSLLEAAPTNATANGSSPIANWDPILISLVRRAMPNLIAYDIAGVQPMTGPTGLIFAMKSRYKDNAARESSSEAFFAEANTAASSSSLDGTTWVNKNGASGSDSSSLVHGALVDANADGVADIFGFAGGMTTLEGEALGDASANQFNEMSFTIERSTVTARTRALKAEYTMELAQDLKAVHGLDAEAELTNILSVEILAEINREIIRTINSRAKLGCRQGDINAAGIFDLNADADGRWSLEKYKGLLVQLQRECNQIAKETRRGKGNFILCSSDVASALSATGLLDYTPALASNGGLSVDDTGNTFAGVLAGGIKVYIDPYSAVNYITSGYRGSSAYDAGIFYAPYVPLTMVRAVGENTFQPKIGFKTRYGMIANPFVGSTTALGVPQAQTPPNGIGAVRANEYYRIFRVDNILGE